MPDRDPRIDLSGKEEARPDAAEDRVIAMVRYYGHTRYAAGVRHGLKLLEQIHDRLALIVPPVPRDWRAQVAAEMARIIDRERRRLEEMEGGGAA